MTTKVQVPHSARAYATLVRATLRSLKADGLHIASFGIGKDVWSQWGSELQALVGCTLYPCYSTTCPWDFIVLEVRDWRSRGGTRRMAAQLTPKGVPRPEVPFYLLLRAERRIEPAVAGAVATVLHDAGAEPTEAVSLLFELQENLGVDEAADAVRLLYAGGRRRP